MSSLMPVARLSEWRMTTRDWQEIAANGDMMARAITLANGGLLEIKLDCSNFRLMYQIYITGCCVLEISQDGNVMTITLECLLVISGKSLFVKTLVNQENIKVRERILHIGLIPNLKSFLDIVPSSFTDITRALRGCFRGGFRSMSFCLVSKQRKTSNVVGCVFFDILSTTEQGRVGSRYILVYSRNFNRGLNKRRMYHSQKITTE